MYPNFINEVRGEIITLGLATIGLALALHPHFFDEFISTVRFGIDEFALLVLIY